MSFAAIDFNKIINEKWETSDLRKLFSKTFLIFVYKKDINNSNYLMDVFKWNIAKSDLEGEIKEVWQKTKDSLLFGKVIKEIKNNKVITYFPREKETTICHVRPHGTNGCDVMRLPVTDLKTGYSYLLKHSFWLNHSYLEKIIKEHKI